MVLFSSCQTGYHRQGVLVFEQPVDVVYNLSGVVVGDLTRPACPNSLRAVHKHHWNDGDVPLRLHLLVVIPQELEQVGVHCWEQQLGKRTVGKDATVRRRTISDKSTALIHWHEQKNPAIFFVMVLPEHGEDITRARSIFPSIDTSTKLTQRLQDVHIVAAHKVLSQVHDGHHERLLHGQIGRDCLYN